MGSKNHLALLLRYLTIVSTHLTKGNCGILFIQIHLVSRQGSQYGSSDDYSLQYFTFGYRNGYGSVVYYLKQVVQGYIRWYCWNFLFYNIFKVLYAIVDCLCSCLSCNYSIKLLIVLCYIYTGYSSLLHSLQGNPWTVFFNLYGLRLYHYMCRSENL